MRIERTSITFMTRFASQGVMPKIELDYKCKKCKNTYPATINYTGDVGDLDLEENQSRCPFCGEWNCADPKSVSDAISEGKRR